MQSIAERGRSAMQWLVVLGVIASWACLDRSPPVVDTARTLLDRLLIRPESLGISGDPLKLLPDADAIPLELYRRQFLHPAFEVDASLVREKREYLQEVSVGSVVELARNVLKDPQVIAAREQTPIKDLLLEPIRTQLARLEVWEQKSGHTQAATLADVETELSTRVQIPGTEQSLGLRQCMLFIGLGIVGLQLYFTSLIATLLDAFTTESEPVERSWLIFHRAPLGPMLSMLTLALPSAAWLAQQLLLPLGEIGRTPPTYVWGIAAAIVITTMISLRQATVARQRLLGKPGVSLIHATAQETFRSAA